MLARFLEREGGEGGGRGGGGGGGGSCAPIPPAPGGRVRRDACGPHEPRPAVALFNSPAACNAKGGRPHASPTPISARPSHVSWPHREHRRSRCHRPHASPTPIWRTPDTFRGPTRSSSSTVPVGPLAYVAHTHSAHRSHDVSWPHRKPHRKSKWGCPHASPTPVPAHPSHVSWPHRELHRPRSWGVAAGMRRPHPCRHPPHKFRGPIIGNSTEGPSGTAARRLRHPHQFRHTWHTFRCHIGSSTEGLNANAARMRPPHIFRHTSFCGPIGNPPKAPAPSHRPPHA